MWSVTTVGDGEFAARAAAIVATALNGVKSFVITGGTTAANVYPQLSSKEGIAWSAFRIYWSDERCVPPDHPESNYALARRTLLDQIPAPSAVNRMRGEDAPAEGAARYHDEVRPVVEDDRGFDLALLGMGGDCHVAGLFPESPALEESRYCAAVDRPDGLHGLTLTPPALLCAQQVIFIVSGTSKAEALKRVLQSDESAQTCPARLLADHPRVQVVTDEAAATLL